LSIGATLTETFSEEKGERKEEAAKSKKEKGIKEK
jgi:hypothetical protein